MVSAVRPDPRESAEVRAVTTSRGWIRVYNEEDWTGRCLKRIPIVVVYNGANHYTPSIPGRPTRVEMHSLACAVGGLQQLMCDMDWTRMSSLPVAVAAHNLFVTATEFRSVLAAKKIPLQQPPVGNIAGDTQPRRNAPNFKADFGLSGTGLYIFANESESALPATSAPVSCMAPPPPPAPVSSAPAPPPVSSAPGPAVSKAAAPPVSKAAVPPVSGGAAATETSKAPVSTSAAKPTVSAPRVSAVGPQVSAISAASNFWTTVTAGSSAPTYTTPSRYPHPQGHGSQDFMGPTVAQRSPGMAPSRKGPTSFVSGFSGTAMPHLRPQFTPSRPTASRTPPRNFSPGMFSRPAGQVVHGSSTAKKTLDFSNLEDFPPLPVSPTKTTVPGGLTKMTKEEKLRVEGTFEWIEDEKKWRAQEQKDWDASCAAVLKTVRAEQFPLALVGHVKHCMLQMYARRRNMIKTNVYAKIIRVYVAAMERDEGIKIDLQDALVVPEEILSDEKELGWKGPTVYFDMKSDPAKIAKLAMSAVEKVQDQLPKASSPAATTSASSVQSEGSSFVSEHFSFLDTDSPVLSSASDTTVSSTAPSSAASRDSVTGGIYYRPKQVPTSASSSASSVGDPLYSHPVRGHRRPGSSSPRQGTEAKKPRGRGGQVTIATGAAAPGVKATSGKPPSSKPIVTRTKVTKVTATPAGVTRKTVTTKTVQKTPKKSSQETYGPAPALPTVQQVILKG